MKNVPWMSICSMAMTIVASVVSAVMSQYNQQQIIEKTGEKLAKVVIDETLKNSGKI